MGENLAVTDPAKGRAADLVTQPQGGFSHTSTSVGLSSLWRTRAKAEAGRASQPGSAPGPALTLAAKPAEASFTTQAPGRALPSDPAGQLPSGSLPAWREVALSPSHGGSHRPCHQPICPAERGSIPASPVPRVYRSPRHGSTYRWTPRWPPGLLLAARAVSLSGRPTWCGCGHLRAEGFAQGLDSCSC